MMEELQRPLGTPQNGTEEIKEEIEKIKENVTEDCEKNQAAASPADLQAAANAPQAPMPADLQAKNAPQAPLPADLQAAANAPKASFPAEADDEALYSAVMKNESVRARIISETLSKNQGVPLLSARGNGVSAPKRRLKSFEEAGGLALAYFRSENK